MDASPWPNGTPDHAGRPPSPSADEASPPRTPPSARRIAAAWSGLRRWGQQNTFAPGWVPAPLRRPIMGYGVATLVDLAAAGATLSLEHLSTQFHFDAALMAIALLLVTFGWGAAPGLYATLLGALLIWYVVVPPSFSWTLAYPSDALGVLLTAVLGLVLCALASLNHQYRWQLEAQARSLADAQDRAVTESRRLRAVLDALPNAVLIAGPHGQSEEYNEANKTLWGGAVPLVQHLADYAVLKTWWPETGRPVAPDEWVLPRALRTGIAQLNDEVEIEALDGQRKRILVSAVPMRDAGETLVGAVVNAQDITELRRLEREVAQRAEELEAIFSATTDGIALLDAQGTIVRTNRAFDQLLGLARDPELPPLSMQERMAALALRDSTGNPLPVGRWPSFHLLAGEALTGEDLLVTTPEGREVVVNVSGAPLCSQTGTILGGVEVLRDVTARRRQEHHTRATMSALVAMGEALVEVLDGATGHRPSDGEPPVAPSTVPLMLRRLADLTCDVLGCRRVSIEAIDPATGMVSPCAFVGLSTAEEQAWWASFAPPQTLEERLTPALAASLRAGHPVWLEGVRLPEPTRRVLLGAPTGMVLPMRLGNALIGTAMVDYADPGHDYLAPDEMQLEETMARLGAQVVERNRLLVERTEARANELALRQTQAQMDTFVGIASHELRAPLTHLQLSLDSTEYHLRKARQRQAAAAGTCAWAVDLFKEHLVRAQQQLDQLGRLISDLVDASRSRAGTLEVHVQPGDLVAIVHQAVEAERAVAADRPILLQVPAEGQVPIVADPGRIEQVVTNYLTNALKYSPSDRPVEVGVQTVGQQARVWVRDEGPGLPEAERERIWERFHRAPGIEVQSGTGVGLGLGLYICRTIVEQHHGHVGVDSAPGAGSTFWFTVPLAEDTEQVPSA